MKRLIDIVRFTLISPEFAWVLALIVLVYIYPTPLIIVGDKIGENDEVWKWLPTLPLIFAGVTFKLSSKVRAPFDRGNKQLYEWFQYNRITDRLYASYFLISASVLATISIWMFSEDLTPTIMGVVFLSSVGVSGFIAFEVFLAAQKIREILEQYGKQL